MFKYIGGNSVKSVLNSSKNILKSNKIPIINFAIEETNKKNLILNEHKKLINSIDHNYKIAIKLSSFDFDTNILNNLINNSIKKKIQVIIDAEKNDDNEIYQNISNNLILNFNKEFPNVIKTYQMYRKDSLDNLKNDLILCNQNNVYLGTKLVRGAYWNSEHKEGHLYTSKYETDLNFDKGIILLSENYNKNYNILATHNKQSIHFANNINNYNNQQIFSYAHLLGMGERNYNFEKYKNIHVYIPYGPYKEMLPYLIRRLYENIDTIKYMF